MTTNEDLFFQEFISPIYAKYEDDPNFIFSYQDGTQVYNVQYALLQESVNDNIFEPLIWDEEDGRKLVIGFTLPAKPEYLLCDAQYSKKENGAVNFMFLIESMKYFNKTGCTKRLIGYAGCGDAYISEVAWNALLNVLSL